MMINTRITKSFLVAFVGIVLSHNANAVRINGNEIEIGDNGGSVSYKVTLNATNIAFKIENDEISVGSLNDDSLIPQANAIYEEIAPQLVALHGVKGVSLKSGERCR